MDEDKTSNDVSEKSLQEGFNLEFPWYQMLLHAASDNFLDIEKVLDTEASSFLYYCNYIVRKNEIENFLYQVKMNKYK